MLTLEELKTLDDSTILRGADAEGNSYLVQMLRLYREIFGGACSWCEKKHLEYIRRLRNHKENTKKMEKKNKYFELKKGVLVPIAGTSEAYSDKNMTDEDAIKILKGNKNAIALFDKYPKDWERMLEAEDKSPRQKELESKTKAELKEMYPNLELSGNKSQFIEAILTYEANTPKTDDTEKEGSKDTQSQEKDSNDTEDVTTQESEEAEDNDSDDPKTDDTEKE